MKKLVQLFLCIFLFVNVNLLAQGPAITSSIQTSNLGLGATTIISKSDINADYYAIVYGDNGSASGNIKYLKVYDANTNSPIGGVTQITSQGLELLHIKIDGGNNIYTVHNEPDPTSSIPTLFLSKYNINGSLIDRRTINNPTYRPISSVDIEVAPNGDILVGTARQRFAEIDVYYNDIGLPGRAIINVGGDFYQSGAWQPMQISMDMKGDVLAVAYTNDDASNISTILKKYQYVPSTPAYVFPEPSMLLMPAISFAGDMSFNGDQQVAIRDDGHIFFIAENVSVGLNRKLIEIDNLGAINSLIGGSTFINGKIDVDLSQNLLFGFELFGTSPTYHQVYLMDNTNTVMHNYFLDAKVKFNFNDLAIHECKFLITGADQLTVPFQEAHHQLFECACGNWSDIQLSRFAPFQTIPTFACNQAIAYQLETDAQFTFRYKYNCATSSTCTPPYTYIETLNGTVSSVVSGSGYLDITVKPNSNDIGFHNLEVFPSENATDCSCGVWFEVVDGGIVRDPGLPIFDPFKSNTVITGTNKEDALIYPNPTNGKIEINFGSDLRSESANLLITDLIGNVVLEQNVSTDRVEIDLTKWASGVYICTFIDGDTKKAEKIVKN